MNNIFQPDILSHLLYVIVLYSVLCFVGIYVTKMLKIGHRNAIVSNFFDTSFSLLFIVTIYALIKTHFQSIYIISLLIFFVLLILSRKTERIDTPIYSQKLRVYFYNLIFLVFIYGISYYFFYIHTHASIIGDNSFYANLSYKINQLGIESHNFDWTKESHPVPYHYTEAWFTSLSMSIFNTKALPSFYLFFIPIFFTSIFQGASALVDILSEKLNIKLFNWCFIIGLLILIIQSIDIPFIEKPIFKTNYDIGSLFSNYKLSVIYLLFLLSASFILLERYIYAYWCILSLISFYPTISVAILSGLGCIFLLLFIQKKISIKQFILLCIPLIILPAIFLLFYYINAEGSSSGEARISIFKTFPTMPRVFFSLILTGLLPSLILYKIFLRTDFRNKIIPLFYFSVFFIIGVISTLIIIPFYIKKDMDGIQLLHNFVSPFITITFFIIISYSLLRLKKLALATTLLIGIYILLLIGYPSVFFNMIRTERVEYSYDGDYYQKIIKNTDINANVGFYRDYNVKNLFPLKPFLVLPDTRLLHFRDNYLPLSLNPHTIAKDSDPRFYHKNDFAFIRFMENSSMKNIDQITLQFIKEYNIKYIIKEKGAEMPDIINTITKQKIKNRINQNEFIILK